MVVLDACWVYWCCLIWVCDAVCCLLGCGCLVGLFILLFLGWLLFKLLPAGLVIIMFV